MTDQVNGLRKRGVKTSVITSSASVPKEMIATEKSLGSDTSLFCAPEELSFPSSELPLNDQIFLREL